LSKELTQAVAGKRIAWLLAILAAMAMLATVAQTAKHAHAVAAITTVGTATASIATNGASGSGVYTNVSNIVLTEGAATDISVGANTFTITAPTGWAWDTGGAVPTITGGGVDITAKTVTQTNASVITVGVTAGGTATVDVITISGLRARPINPATAIGSANGAAAVTAGAIAGFPIAAAVTFTATAAGPVQQVITFTSTGVFCFVYAGSTTPVANFSTFFTSSVVGVNIMQLPAGNYLSWFRAAPTFATATSLTSGQTVCVAGTVGSNVFS
jgi:hypothetical protein